MPSKRARSVRSVALAAVLLVPMRAHASQAEGLASAARLYEEAQYEEALAILDQLTDTSPDGPVRAGQDRVAEYRALCLMALGRLDEAEQALENLLQRKPLYEPQSGDPPPRFATLLTSVRTRVLPHAIRARFRAARKSFDIGERAGAEQGFREVLLWYQRSELELAAKGGLEDVAVLAEGFLTLMSANAATSPPATTAAPTETPADPGASNGTAPVQTKAGTDATAGPSAIFGPEDLDVEAPQTLRRTVPPWPANLGRATFDKKQVMLELVVSASGDVESAVLKGSVNPFYDAVLTQAARTWRFRPAMKNGAPVRYRKPVLVMVTPDSRDRPL